MTSCAISGHRPTRFKFGYKETHTGCKRLKRVMREQFDLLYQQGVREFYVGGALGVDMWAAEILLRMKEQSAYASPLSFAPFCRIVSSKYRVCVLPQESISPS